MYQCFLIVFVFISQLVYAQNSINGTVTDGDGIAIIGANIFIEGTYDGTVSELDGSFSFNTNETGQLNLIVSYLGYESKSVTGIAEELAGLTIQLRASATALDAVEITGSTFAAGDNSKIAVLNSLEMLTTAGSLGDVIAAMQTLPGTQSNAEDGRLFVRGGDARETAVFIDGLKVFSPFNKTIGGSPTRGRYSPLLFKGVSFSTGGYSSAFGQALSGVLDMKSIDEPNETISNINLMSIGAGIGHTQKWAKQSLSINTSYTNLKPYDLLVPSKVNWEKPFANITGEAIYRLKTKNGLFKTYIAGDVTGFELNRSNFDTGKEELIKVENKNIYANSNYLGFVNDQTSIYAGFSLGLNADDSSIDDNLNLEETLNGSHIRIGGKTIVSDRFVTNYGIDYLVEVNNQRFTGFGEESSDDLNRKTASAYFESDYFFSKYLAIKTGLRTEYSFLLDGVSLLPRVTLAYKFNKESQVSSSYGKYNQVVDAEYAFISNSLGQENAQHFILNYSRKTNKQILRLETYYKRYADLISYDVFNGLKTNTSNNGDGYAYGLDLFYRANQVVDNLDMWVSYSWLENKRNYLDFVESAPTQFSTVHNISLVGKYFMQEWKSLIGITYKMASGRPYNNPNTADFMSERSKYYNSVNLSWSYLISQQKILFVSVSNATRFRNNYGYEYKSQTNDFGDFESRLIEPNDDQFFFVGFFMTLSKNKSINQLNNL